VIDCSNVGLSAVFNLGAGFLHGDDAGFDRRGEGVLAQLRCSVLLGDLSCTGWNIVEKLFQTNTMRVGRFHETWNGSQPSAERWLTAYTAYYNHPRSHEAL
jgi:putative transposase